MHRSVSNRIAEWFRISKTGDAEVSRLQFHGRVNRIRTCDPLTPSQVRYQAAPSPDMQFVRLLDARKYSTVSNRTAQDRFSKPAQVELRAGLQPRTSLIAGTFGVKPPFPCRCEVGRHVGGIDRPIGHGALIYPMQADRCAATPRPSAKEVRRSSRRRASAHPGSRATCAARPLRPARSGPQRVPSRVPD